VDFLPSKTVIFASCSVDESQYQSVEIHNRSDTATFYRFSSYAGSTFRIYPHVGLIPEKSFCIVNFEFTPKSFKLYSETILCFFNDSPNNTVKLTLNGYCSKP